MGISGQGVTQLPEPEFRLTGEEFRLFSELVYQVCGFKLSDDKKTFLESRLRKRMTQTGQKNAMEYYRRVSQGPTRPDEIFHLLDALLIGETFFFRNRPQFQLFADVALPELLGGQVMTTARPLRIWSAGCSTGQEPYSIAMTVLEKAPRRKAETLQVFASDLSMTALERAQAGLYRSDQIGEIPAPLLRKYFQPENGQYRACAELRKCVVFDYHNLKHDHGLRDLDVIFCRNVMIYFTRDEQKRLIERFANRLVPGGYLFIGHAETMSGMSDRFTMLHLDKGIAWRLDR
ncbi:MAG: CheR family methyltransferase [Blastocatellia bacterium]